MACWNVEKSETYHNHRQSSTLRCPRRLENVYCQTYKEPMLLSAADMIKIVRTVFIVRSNRFKQLVHKAGNVLHDETRQEQVQVSALADARRTKR